jgi:hypothetical protein
MRLYSRKNKDDLYFNRFDIDLKLPVVKKIKLDNEFSPIFGFDVMFNTQIIYRKDQSFIYFELTLLGVGVSIINQDSF